MRIKLIEAGPDDLAIVRNLMNCYVYDLSEHTGWDCGDDGTFGDFPELPDYWEDPDGFPFLIRARGRLAGFAIVMRIEDGPPPLYDMVEFFIMRKYRRAGVGRTVARRLFNRFPGRWQVRELVENAPAQAFWRRIIDEITHGAYDETEEDYRSPHAGTYPMVWQRFTTGGDG